MDPFRPVATTPPRFVARPCAFAIALSLCVPLWGAGERGPNGASQPEFPEDGLDARDLTSGGGFANAVSDLPQHTAKGGTLYVFSLP
ncbi:hypothetical protein DB347_22245 [Opitutaceae bacterium EW11]|nr:hypothetical protein DB347_22245 [Opitutaceae bacterium EW11]